jgi:hypothetical protein
LAATGHDLKGLVIMGCEFSGTRGDAILINTGYTNFQIIGNNMGPGADFGGNSGVAINLLGSNDNYVISGNKAPGNTGGALAGFSVGANKRCRDNIGFVTSNRGLVNITTGTSVTVNHGLRAAPASEQIAVNPVTNPGANGWWVSAVTATSSTISLASAAAVNFAWRADLAA